MIIIGLINTVQYEKYDGQLTYNHTILLQCINKEKRVLLKVNTDINVINNQLHDFLTLNNVTLEKDITMKANDLLSSKFETYPNFQSMLIEKVKYVYKASYYHLIKIENNELSESNYQIFELTRLFDSDSCLKFKTIKSFQTIYIDKMELDKRYNLIEHNNNEVDILIPDKLVKECFISMLYNFHIKSIFLKQSSFNISEINNKIVPDIDLQIIYPESATFDLDGKELKSKFLLKNGYFKNYLSYIGDLANPYGDTVVMDTNEPASFSWIDIKLSINSKATYFDFIAKWEESYIILDPNSQLILYQLYLIDITGTKYTIKKGSIEFNEFLKKCKQYKNDYVSLVPCMVVRL